MKSVPWTNQRSGEACAVLLFEGELCHSSSLGSMASSFQRQCEMGKFSGKKDQMLRLFFPDSQFSQLFAVGMGPRDKATPETWRRAAAEAVRGARRAEVRELVLLAPQAQEPLVAQALAEGALLANDPTRTYQTAKKDKESSVDSPAEKNGTDPLETILLADGHEEGLGRGGCWLRARSSPAPSPTSRAT